MSRQASLFPERHPPGFRLIEELVGRDEEAALLARLNELDWREVRMRGQVARRTTRHFGWTYGYESATVSPADPVPDWLLPLRARVAGLMGLEPEALAEVLCSRYPPGAGIGWHRDAPAFGPEVGGVSLGAACRMRFRLAEGEPSLAVSLPPRSAYVLGGEARASWRHSIPAVPELRHSITFRTLAPQSRGGVRA